MTSTGKERFFFILSIALRLVLGGIFLSSGLRKLGHLDDFYLAAQAYKILTPDLIQIYAGWLPWLEVLTGLCLLLGLFVRFAAGLSGAMLLSFLIAIATVLLRGDSIDCGCYPGGPQPTPLSWDLWIRDLLMLGGAAALFFIRDRRWSLDGYFERNPDWKMIPVILLVLYGVVTGMVALTSKTPEPPPPPPAPMARPLLPVGSVLPDFRLQDLDGKTVSLSDSRNKKTVLVEIFATWCPHCQHSVPLLKQLQAAHPEDLQILAINAGDRPGTPPTGATFRMQYGVSFPILADGSDAFINKYHITGFPTLYLVNPSGVIIWQHSGSLHEKAFAELQAVLKR